MANMAKYSCWPIYLVTFRPWECENSCPVSVGRVGRTQQLHSSGDLNFQEFNYWLEFVHFYVWKGKPFHIRERRLNISPLVIGTLLFSFIEHLIWFNGRITYCLFSAAARDEGVRRCFHARSVRSVSIVRAPLLLRSRSVKFSGEIGSPLFAQPSVQIRNLIRNSNLDNKRRSPAGCGWTTLGRIILFCTSLSLSLSFNG